MSTSSLEHAVDAAAFESELRAVVRGDVSFDLVSRGIHATDASHYQMMPACVVAPRDEADLVSAMQVAHRFSVPMTMRGGATSLSGQTFGTGMVLDVSKYLDRVLEVNVDEQWVRVQPGVIRDRLNAQLAPTGLHLAPDPATANRATVGGMIGNNASGTRSIVYGKTIDHLISCRVALADGTVMDLEPLDPMQWQQRSEGAGREARIYRGVRDLCAENREEILARYPRVMRRVAGYNLDEFVDGAGYTGPIGGRNDRDPGVWNLAHLMAGSEGTLGCLLQAKLRLTPLPSATALAIVHFDDELEALRHVTEILRHQPSAVELLDALVLREAVVNASTRALATFLEGQPRAVLLVEVFGDDAAGAQRRIRALVDDLRARGIGYAWPIRTDVPGQANVWNVRKLGLGLISNVRGPVKGQAFVEDACVPVEVLAEYIERLQQVCREEGVSTTMYAHASVGVLHFRPQLDLHCPEDQQKMVRIARRAFEMVCQYGGAFSGEHGDGVVRGQFLLDFYGPQLYEAFRELKRLFDPDGLMNPGKIVDTPPMTDHLRYGPPYRSVPLDTHFHYRSQDGFQLAIEQCNGVGACRKLEGGTMCPSYMATRDEEASTRGRANALRLALTGQLGEHGLESDRIQQVLELCLACKACQTECPNAVDMARLKSEVLQMHHDRHGVPWGYRLVGGLPEMAKWLAGPPAHLVNLLARLPGYSWVLERLAGLDRRRRLPAFATRTLRQQVRARTRTRKENEAPAGTRGRVALFDDTYANFLEPGVGLAAIALLEGCGYEVVLARAGCCQRPRLSKGLVRAAKRHGTRTLERLDPWARQGIPILCLEPSCASALADDLPDLIDDQALGRRVAAHIHMLDGFLDAEVAAGKIPPLTALGDRFLLHGHCHQKAGFGTAAIHRHFARLPQVRFREVDSGCCGMAGSFGFEHYELSRQIGEQRLFPAVRDAVARGETIIACGTSCRQQLKDCLEVTARHWVEVMAPGIPQQPAKSGTTSSLA